MGWENWLLYAIGLLVAGISAFWVYMKTQYWPHKHKLEELRVNNELEIQKTKEVAAENQRQHEREMAKREADEKERQREHERQIAKDRATAETNEGDNLWKQVVEMQTKLMKRDEDTTEFIIGLATDRIDRAEDRIKDAAKEIAQANILAAEKIAEAYKAVTHQMIEVRTSLSVLVQDAVSREQERQNLKKIPQALLELMLQQQIYQEKQYDLMKEVRAFIKPDEAIAEGNGKP